VATVSVVFSNPDEGATDPSHLGIGDDGGCPILSAFFAERVGYRDSRPPDFHNTASLRLKSLPRITLRSCILFRRR
jgi:hypothetical protein